MLDRCHPRHRGSKEAIASVDVSRYVGVEHENLNHDSDSRQAATELIHLCLMTPLDVVHVRTEVLGYASKANIATRGMITRLFSKHRFIMLALYYLHEISSDEPIRFYRYPSPRSRNMKGSSARPQASISQTGTGQMDHSASFSTRSLINTTSRTDPDINVSAS